MKILFVSDLHYLPQRSGGAQSLIHELALELLARGHQPAVLAPLHHEGSLGLRNRALMKLLRRQTIRDDVMGYPAYRRWLISSPLDAPIAEIRPDAAVVMPSAAVALAKELVRLGIPTTAYLQDVEFQHLGGDPRDLDGVAFATNSEFTRGRYERAFGIDSAVIPPLMRPDLYRAERRPTNVTMINPHPLKGGDLALEIAGACPEIPFCFVNCWVLPPDDQRNLEARVRALPNAILRPATGDMKSIYSRAKILLAPSKWEEAWGRVASEAHFNGIPVVASDRGGLRESVGPGGVLLDPDGPVEPWVEAVRRLWSDEAYYAAKSAAALAYSTRAAIEPGHLIDALLATIAESIAVRRGSAPPPPQKTKPVGAIGAN
jgi:glycosyltransferase involved in cell wall biosynthesis